MSFTFDFNRLVTVYQVAEISHQWDIKHISSKFLKQYSGNYVEVKKNYLISNKCLKSSFTMLKLVCVKVKSYDLHTIHIQHIHQVECKAWIDFEDIFLNDCK